jgi:hypothetical protein
MVPTTGLAENKPKFQDLESWTRRKRGSFKSKMRLPDLEMRMPVFMMMPRSRTQRTRQRGNCYQTQ